jgi:uncharacterized protein YheU (UPF0270 family)
MMQIRKTYQAVNPELLNAEIKDFILKQGTSPGEDKLETYTLPNESAIFGTRSTLTFNISDKECVRVHMLGSAKGETKLMIDVNEKLFPQEKISALEADIDFIFGSYEAK